MHCAYIMSCSDNFVSHELAKNHRFGVTCVTYVNFGGQVSIWPMADGAFLTRPRLQCKSFG